MVEIPMLRRTPFQYPTQLVPPLRRRIRLLPVSSAGHIFTATDVHQRYLALEWRLFKNCHTVLMRTRLRPSS